MKDKIIARKLKTYFCAKDVMVSLTYKKDIKKGETEVMLANIEKERILKKMTQEQLAVKLGVSHKTYYNWINEKKDIPSKKLQELSQIFGVSMEYLLGGEQKRILYLCDGNVPTCKKSICYKNAGESDPCSVCHYTKDVTHAVNFKKTRSPRGSYLEKGPAWEHPGLKEKEAK